MTLFFKEFHNELRYLPIGSHDHCPDALEMAVRKVEKWTEPPELYSDALARASLFDYTLRKHFAQYLS